MKAWSLLLLAACPYGIAFEREDTRGLDIVIEAMPEPVSVEGVAMQIQYARGSDVAELAHRIEQRWRNQGNPLRHLRERGWQIVSRWEAGRSELIQWRGTGNEATLVHSSLDTTRKIARPATPPFVLPPVCVWGSAIHGETMQQEYRQVSARCRTGIAALRVTLRSSLAAQGWAIRGGSSGALELSKDAVTGILILGHGPARGECALVWIATRAAAGRH